MWSRPPWWASEDSLRGEEWELTVKLMEAYGLQVTAEERTAIIDHLAAGGRE